jgi:hypothetical protein
VGGERGKDRQRIISKYIKIYCIRLGRSQRKYIESYWIIGDRWEKVRESNKGA